MSMMTCPHCGASTPPGAFCESCGKALPSASTGPRVLDGASLPTTSAGQQLVGDELQKQTKKAANTLLAIGLLQMVCGAIVVVLLTSVRRQNAPNQLSILLIAQFGVAAIFIGLFF